jgi:hypothetical protein
MDLFKLINNEMLCSRDAADYLDATGDGTPHPLDAITAMQFLKNDDCLYSNETDPNDLHSC